MMPSRGMGAIDKAKVPKIITRKDKPQKVAVYKKGGVVTPNKECKCNG